MKPTYPERYRAGLKRNGWHVIAWALGTWGTIWLVIEPASAYSAGFRKFIDDNGSSFFYLSLAIALLVILIRLPEPLSADFLIKGTNTKIVINFADLFAQDGHIGIGVNEFFDCDLGEIVSPKSVHGQFVSRIYSGDTAQFRKDVFGSLDGVAGKKVQRAAGNKERFQIGTTACLVMGDKKYFLVALAKTDVKTHKASASVPLLWEALEGLWSCVRNKANGDRICVPLFGGGLSGVPLDPEQLLRLLLMSVLVATRNQSITSEICVILHRSVLGRIDIRRIAREWT